MAMGGATPTRARRLEWERTRPQRLNPMSTEPAAGATSRAQAEPMPATSPRQQGAYTPYALSR